MTTMSSTSGTTRCLAAGAARELADNEDDAMRHRGHLADMLDDIKKRLGPTPRGVGDSARRFDTLAAITRAETDLRAYRRKLHEAIHTAEAFLRWANARHRVATSRLYKIDAINNTTVLLKTAPKKP